MSRACSTRVQPSAVTVVPQTMPTVSSALPISCAVAPGSLSPDVRRMCEPLPAAPDVSRAELERLAPDRLVVVGGPAAVSAAVEDALAEHL
jgi:hypothetical protein